MKVILVDETDLYTTNYALAFTAYVVNDDEAEVEARAVLLGMLDENRDILAEMNITFEDVQAMSLNGLKEFVARRNILSTKVHILDVDFDKPSRIWARSLQTA